MSLPIRQFDGLLFIGDPHVWSKQPGRRLDANFCDTVCGKLKESFVYATDHNLLPLILGDLFDDENDMDPEMLTKIIRTFSYSRHRPLTLVGNHEKTQFYLTDDTALAVLRESQTIDTLEKTGLHEVVEIQGQRIGIGGTPYGQDIPAQVMDLRKDNACDWIIWMTHHDLAFDSAYPGALEIPEIKGADLLVNGHMHKPQKPIQKGNMMAFNPGNITRMSVDCLDQVPSIWVWKPEFKQHLEQHPLQYHHQIFNLEGLMGKSSVQTVEEAHAQELFFQSRFASLLKKNQIEDAKKSDDGVFLKEDMEGLFAQEKTPPQVRSILLDLLTEVLAEEHGSES